MNNIGVLTSGGDSPGMNAAVRAVVRACIYHGIRVHGIQRGYQGLIDNDIAEMGPRSVSGIVNRGGTILRTARCMPFLEPEGRAQAAANLKIRGIEGLVVIGGDGSYRGAQKLHDEHGTMVIGLPGTIDNDIGGTDYTIGFDTALNTAMEAIDRVRDTAASHDRIFFVEVMGRHSGFIAMMSAIAGGAEEVLTPEEPTDIEELVNALRRGRENGKTSMIVVVAEGDDAGDAITIAKQVAEVSEFKGTRVTVIGHLQRGGSPSAFDRAIASRMGVRAVEALIAGETGKMVGIKGTELVLCPLSDAWEKRSQYDPGLLQISRILAT
ncbi:MAG: 6-phosphofructokinase [Candidatus Hydrogenedentes bacterium]|nr:6-phosphofructokinase [Candidatus Hydrogenedentota bacterium]